MEWVSAYAIETRHGDRVTPIAAEVINEIRQRTWNVMNRFIEYRKYGSSPLDTIKFSLLSHNLAFPFPKP
jgi:hypothetical protein